ncbi:PGPGW domain-containing protein [Colwellia sp. MEBiC06753]
MTKSCKKFVITIFGGLLALIGLVFILLPGPAFIFLPLGLAILSLEYPLAKRWLKKSQYWMKQAAIKADALLAKIRKIRINRMRK